MPQGFIPPQDKDYLVAFAQLPDGATLDRTERVIRQMSTLALEHPCVANSVAFPGLSINGFVNAPNTGIAFVTLKPSHERARMHDMDANHIVGALNQRFASIQEAFVGIFPPPPVQGPRAGRWVQAVCRGPGGARLEELYRQVQQATAAGQQERSPGCSRAFRSACRRSTCTSIANG